MSNSAIYILTMILQKNTILPTIQEAEENAEKSGIMDYRSSL